MLDEQLPSECKKLLRAINTLNKRNIEYPTLIDLSTILHMSKSDIMMTAKYLSDNDYVHVDFGDGETIYLIELKFKGKHYVKTRGVENFRIWLPIVLSIVSLILSFIALLSTM